MEQRRVVLIVEDHPGVRDTLEQMVESWAEVDCLLANGFLGAASLVATSPKIDLLICDVDLPGEMTGVDLAEVAVKTFPDIAIVMISGHAKFNLAGMTDRYCFARKPFDRQTLVAHIENAFTASTVAPATEGIVGAEDATVKTAARAHRLQLVPAGRRL